ncbi:MAG TPA: outer membrane beta-barrel protein [Rhodanobacter sp.]|nr:outer membrane beta-barrel protein [Rhodanobacter sp.]
MRLTDRSAMQSRGTRSAEHVRYTNSSALRRQALYVALAMAMAAASGTVIAQAATASKAATAPREVAQDAPVSPSGWTLVPGLSFGISYDSNVFATSDQPQADMLMTVTPSMLIRKGSSGRSLTFEAEGSAAQYRTNSSENSRDYRLDVSGSQRIDRYGNLFGGLGISRSHEDRTSPDDVFGTRPTVFTDAHAHIGIAQRWQSFSLRTGATYNHLVFHNVTDAAGAVIDNGDRNRDVLGLGMRFGYALSRQTDLFVQGTLDRRRYERELDDNGYRRDSQGDSWVVGLARSGKGALTGEVYLGEMSQRYDDPRLPDVTLPTAGVSLTWNAPGRTSLSASYSRSILETTLPGASSYVDTSVGVRADHRVDARLSTHAAITVTRSDFRGIGRRDDVIDTSVGLSYRLSRRVFLDGDYRLLQRHSDLPGANYDRQEIYLGLRLDGGAATAITAAAAATTAAASESPEGPSGFYLGTTLGYNVFDTRVTGPRGEHGGYRGDFAGSGATASVFAGYGHTFGRAYCGIEADSTRANVDWNHDKSPDSRVFMSEQRRGEGLALNVGYVLPGDGLIFASVGRRRTHFDNSYAAETGTAYVQDDTRLATRHGIGVDMPLSSHVFVRARYDITRYDGYDVAYDGGADRFSGSTGEFQLGLGWRLGSVAAGSHVAAGLDGFYAGAQGGDDRSGSKLDAVHRQPGPPASTNFRADFGGRGNDIGAFAGYGHAFGPLYAGLELEDDASRTGWRHEKLPDGRDFSVETRGSYGAALRLGYAARSGALIYARAGRVRGRFHTVYVKGENPDAWVSREDNRAGTRLGVGVEAPLSASMFIRLDYTSTRYNAIAFNTTQAKADDLHFANRQQLFRIGLGLRF